MSEIIEPEIIEMEPEAVPAAEPVTETTAEQVTEPVTETTAEPVETPEPVTEPPKRRGRKPKPKDEPADVAEPESETEPEPEPAYVKTDANDTEIPTPKKRGRKPKGTEPEPAASGKKKTEMSPKVARMYAGFFVSAVDAIQQHGIGFMMKLKPEEIELLAFDDTSKECLLEAYAVWIEEDFPEITPLMNALILTAMTIGVSFFTAKMTKQMRME